MYNNKSIFVKPKCTFLAPIIVNFLPPPCLSKSRFQFFSMYMYMHMYATHTRVKNSTGFPFVSLLFLRQTESDNSQWRQRKY